MTQALALDSLRPASRLFASASIEVSPRSPTAADDLADWLPPGTETFINFVPGTDFTRSVAMARSLRRAGFVPVPHLSARHLASGRELAEQLARLAGEAGITRVFCIGGDVAVPRGPYAAALDVIASGALAEHGIAAVGFAGYPEGHHIVAPAVIEEALHAKLGAAKAQGLDAFIVTQLCFETAPILAWLRRLRESEGGIGVPVRIGVAGPTSIRTLLTFAMRCGVGPSLRMLLNQPQSIGRLLRDASQDDLVAVLETALAGSDSAVGLHLFPFGGLAKTAAWRRRALQ